MTSHPPEAKPAEAHKLTVSIIIHNDFSHIAPALQSLYQHTSLPVRIYITVNAGSEADIERVRQAYPDLNLRINDQARGFATNHNDILRVADTPYTALLNDDITVHPGALDTLVTYLETHLDVGLVGPLVLNPDGTLQQSVFSDPSLFRMLYAISGLGRLTPHGGSVRRLLTRLGLAGRLGVESLKIDPGTRSVPVVVGVAMVVRREACLQAGLMDEATRFYGEEFGWHWRLRQYGWKIALVTEALVTHHNRAQDLSGWKLAEHRKAILNYYLLYRPQWQAFIIRISIIIAHLFWAVVFLPFRTQQARAHWGAVNVGLAWRPAVSQFGPAMQGSENRT
jgi:N-acetylglucosaminyl-diphospho-decaprenol L-rhamnosyltransferase